jgi:hypothetical protein
MIDFHKLAHDVLRLFKQIFVGGAPETPKPNIVDLGAIVRDGKLQLARAFAIEGYAKVERSLSLLFASLLGTSLDKAGVVFFRITNTHSRNTILETLLQKAHGDKFRVYWQGTRTESGLFTLIRQLDQRRNELVHWHVLNEIAIAETSHTSREVLKPPNFWNRPTDTQSISVEDLAAFILKADFVHRSLNMFHMATSDMFQITEAEREPWLRIFEQPVSYPPPDTHPLSPNYREPETPPQSSQA